MSSYQIGGYVGAFIITLLATRAVRSVFIKRMDKRTASLVAFGVCLVAILAITTLTMGFSQGLTTYGPWLVLWLIVDMLRSSKQQGQQVPKRTSPTAAAKMFRK